MRREVELERRTSPRLSRSPFFTSFHCTSSMLRGLGHVDVDDPPCRRAFASPAIWCHKSFRRCGESSVTRSQHRQSERPFGWVENDEPPYPRAVANLLWVRDS